MSSISVSEVQPSKLNPANAFTLMRVPLGLVGMIIFTTSPWWGVVIIVAAALTDFFDGIVARAFDCVSDFGEDFDPTVDKVFQGLVLVFTFTQVGLFGLRLQLVAIAAVELAIIVLTLYVRHQKRTLKVTWAGKKGMFGRMTCVTWLLAGSIGDSHGWYGRITTIGQLAGIVGIFLGAWAFREYIAQWKARPKLDGRIR